MILMQEAFSEAEMTADPALPAPKFSEVVEEVKAYKKDENWISKRKIEFKFRCEELKDQAAWYGKLWYIRPHRSKNLYIEEVKVWKSLLSL